MSRPDISLREAITAANALTGDDVIINLPSGTYRLTLVGADEDSNALGDLDVSSNPNSLIIRGNGTTATLIDGNNTDRVFDFATNGDYTLERLTVQNGLLQGADGADATGSAGAAGADGATALGGGLKFLVGSDITLSGVTVKNCRAISGHGGRGADVSNAAGSKAGNGGSAGDALGGGIYIQNTGSLTATQVIVTNCQAVGGNGGAGGDAIDGSRPNPVGGNGGAPSTAAGGGMYINGNGPLTFTDCIISNNTVRGGTGGQGGDAAHASVGNALGGAGSSGYDATGGGIELFVNSSTAKIIQFTNVTITGNTVQGGNGGAGGNAWDAPNGNAVGGDGGSGSAGSVGGMDAFRPGFFNYISGTVSDNIAIGGSGGKGGNAGLTGASVAGSAIGGAGGDAGGAEAGGVNFFNQSSFGNVQLAAVTISNNSVTGGAGAAGGDAISGAGAAFLKPGSGGNGGDAEAGGLIILRSLKYTEIDGGPIISGNTGTAGAGAQAGQALSNGNGAAVTAGGSGAGGLATNPQASNLPPIYTTIGDLAWKEIGGVANVYDVGTDTVLPNMLVTLTESAGKLLGQTYTDVNGNYSFNTGYSGAAKLQFGLNGGNLTPVTQDVGSDDTVDSDIVAGTGITATFTITSGVDNLTLDAGFTGPPQVATLTLTLAGTVSSGVSSVAIGTTSVAPSAGAYTISVSVPASTEYVDMVTSDSDGNQSTRRININTLVMGGG